MDKKTEIFRVLFNICAGIGIYIVGYLLATSIMSFLPGVQELHIMYINAVAMAVAALVLIPFIRKDEYGFAIKKKQVLQLLAVMFMAYSSSIVFNVLLSRIPWQAFATENAAPNAAVFFGIPLWARMLCYEIVAPVSEELLFRQIIYKRLTEIAPLWVSVLVSSLLFGIYHGNLMQGVYAFIMGILLALAYEWTGSLLAPILFHVVANHVSDIAYEFKSVGQIIYSSYGFMVAVIVFAVSLIILIKNKNKCSIK